MPESTRTVLDDLADIQAQLRDPDTTRAGEAGLLADRKRLILAALEDRYRQAEIARALDISPERVGQLIRRAREQQT